MPFEDRLYCIQMKRNSDLYEEQQIDMEGKKVVLKSREPT